MSSGRTSEWWRRTILIATTSWLGTGFCRRYICDSSWTVMLAKRIWMFDENFVSGVTGQVCFRFIPTTIQITYKSMWMPSFQQVLVHRPMTNKMVWQCLCWMRMKSCHTSLWGCWVPYPMPKLSSKRKKNKKGSTSSKKVFHDHTTQVQIYDCTIAKERSSWRRLIFSPLLVHLFLLNNETVSNWKPLFIAWIKPDN